MATLTITETDRYRFDAEKADKPIRFIERYLKHWEGRFAGTPFILLEWEKDIIRNLFGWVDRETGCRRFQELYLLTAKGSGKTPCLAAIGMYAMLGDQESAAHIVSMASSFEQANLTFDCAKRFISQSADLQRFCAPKQYQIRGPKGAKWTIVSGKPTGRSGPRPSCLIADECHEWPAWTGEAFELLSANLFKRAQPLLMVATNAGASRTCYAWRLHERAMKVLNGNSQEETLLPVIYEAPAELPWDSECAARAANPSLGSFISFSQLAPKLAHAKEDPSAQAEYERLYLSRWIQGGKKWLDLRLWDQAAGEIDPAKLDKPALFVGLDMSQGDDLCAAAYVYATAARFYLDAEFWLPQATADHYTRIAATPYAEWAKAGKIHLLPDRTISPEVCRQIADSIIARHKVTPIKAVCYDPYRANHAIAALEAAGIVCVATRQGYTLSPGCEELDRRLKDGSITITANPVLRAHAETVEVTSDIRGNMWPVKPLAHAGFAGKRSAKIDGIAATVTAMVEARKHDFPKQKSVAKAFII
jgi:phage terminase large subunit-like protein